MSEPTINEQYKEIEKKIIEHHGFYIEDLMGERYPSIKTKGLPENFNIPNILITTIISSNIAYDIIHYVKDKIISGEIIISEDPDTLYENIVESYPVKIRRCRDMLNNEMLNRIIIPDREGEFSEDIVTIDINTGIQKISVYHNFDTTV